MTKLYLTKTIPNKDKQIELTYEFTSDSHGKELKDMDSVVEKFNKSAATFEKAEMPEHSAKATKNEEPATEDEKLIHSIQNIFMNARAKAFNEGRTGRHLSEIETKIIQRIIYG